MMIRRKSIQGSDQTTVYVSEDIGVQVPGEGDLDKVSKMLREARPHVRVGEILHHEQTGLDFERIRKRDTSGRWRQLNGEKVAGGVGTQWL